MTVDVSEWSYQIATRSIGPDLNSTVGKNRLSKRVAASLAQLPARRSEPTPRNLQDIIDIFGEQVTVDAVGDLSRYFRVTQARGFTPGGLATGLSPLAIGPGDVRPSNTAISVIGEGLAGWYLGGQQLRPLARPIGEGVDLIFQDLLTRPRRYALVQVKATQQRDILGQMKRSLPDLLQYGYNVAAVAPPNTYTCYVIGVVIAPSGDFDLLSLRLDFA